jgi:hypothetical protein
MPIRSNHGKTMSSLWRNASSSEPRLARFFFCDELQRVCGASRSTRIPFHMVVVARLSGVRPRKSSPDCAYDPLRPEIFASQCDTGVGVGMEHRTLVGKIED